MEHKRLYAVLSAALGIIAMLGVVGLLLFRVAKEKGVAKGKTTKRIFRLGRDLAWMNFGFGVVLIVSNLIL